MARIIHHTVVASTGCREMFDRMVDWVEQQPEGLRRLCLFEASRINGVQTLCMIPDGSAEGYEASDQGDRYRSKVIERLQGDIDSDGQAFWRWAEVCYGECMPQVLASDQDLPQTAAQTG